VFLQKGANRLAEELGFTIDRGGARARGEAPPDVVVDHVFSQVDNALTAKRFEDRARVSIWLSPTSTVLGAR
jgi:hypothetical protein